MNEEYPETIEMPVWWNTGSGISYRREGLPGDHPEHPYNYIKRRYNVNPESYGVYKPFKREQAEKDVDELNMD